jgi:hypothetical protein
METATAHQIEIEERPAAGLRLVDLPPAEPADATAGMQIGIRPSDDATQGRTLGSDWHDDATRARPSRV